MNHPTYASPINNTYVTPPVPFYHPHHLHDRPLLHLYPVDGPNCDAIDYDVALIACGIITGNTWKLGAFISNHDNEWQVAQRDENNLLHGTAFAYLADARHAQCKSSQATKMAVQASI